MIRFGNGLSALIEMATNCLINHPRWHVCATDGTCVIDDWRTCKGRIVKLNTDEQMEWADDIEYTEAGLTRTMAPLARSRPCRSCLCLKVVSDWRALLPQHNGHSRRQGGADS